MSPLSSFTIGIAGSGGDGVVLLGELLARTAAAGGLHVFLTKNFGPQIRGGETSCRLTLSDAPLHCPGDRVDLLAVLNWDGLARFQRELLAAPDAAALYDARHGARPDLLAAVGAAGPPMALPLEELALEQAGSKQARNMVLGGVLCALLGWPAEAFTAQLAPRLGEAAGAGNARAAVRAAELVAGAVGPDAVPALGPAGSALDLLTGNSAVCRGALHGGCTFMAGYPISPATEILEHLMRELPQQAGQCVQAEDEIAAAGLALGSSYGGVRAMTATSGPGFSLMAESIGLGVMAELPLVVVDVQRVGPSTGIPTRTEQADLNMALYGRHGDAPCPVLAPVSIADCAELTRAAFEIAAEYRTPVILLSDQYLAQGVQTVGPGTSLAGPGPTPAPAGDKTSDGGSRGAPRPSQPKLHGGMADGARPGPTPPASLSGLVRDASGEPSSDPAVHAAMCRARAAKLDRLARSQPLCATYDPPAGAGLGAASRLGLLTWGSSYGPCCALADALAEQGVAASVFAPRMVCPLPVGPLRHWLSTVGRVFLPELNHSGQFWHYLRGQLDLPLPLTPYHRPGGAAFTVEELLEQWERQGDQ
jgi:2-oxoglutarate ferredoxin oxidoreductase subunit alpha